MNKYKIWVQIEEYDDDADVYTDVSEPREFGEYDGLEEAQAAMESLVG